MASWRNEGFEYLCPCGWKSWSANLDHLMAAVVDHVALCSNCQKASLRMLRHDLETPSSTEVDSRSIDAAKGPQISDDPVNSPGHYKWLPVEAIEITEHFSFTLGNALKYILRADHKGKPIEDLKKARWYLDREIRRRESGAA